MKIGGRVVTCPVLFIFHVVWDNNSVVALLMAFQLLKKDLLDNFLLKKSVIIVN